MLSTLTPPSRTEHGLRMSSPLYAKITTDSLRPTLDFFTTTPHVSRVSIRISFQTSCSPTDQLLAWTPIVDAHCGSCSIEVKQQFRTHDC
eukprot:scaffold53198_cov27-Prasinocladus_malaysianus.AAC.7